MTNPDYLQPSNFLDQASINTRHEQDLQESIQGAKALVPSLTDTLLDIIETQSQVDPEFAQALVNCRECFNPGEFVFSIEVPVNDGTTIEVSISTQPFLRSPDGYNIEVNGIDRTLIIYHGNPWLSSTEGSSLQPATTEEMQKYQDLLNTITRRDNGTIIRPPVFRRFPSRFLTAA